jgi:hypothetical protein
MTRPSARLLLVALCALTAVEAVAQERARLLPFRNSVELTVHADWPSPPEDYGANLILFIQSQESFPAAEACFALDSTRIDAMTLRINVLGRRSCEARSFESRLVPTIFLRLRTPQRIRLVLESDSALINVSGPDGVKLGAFHIDVVPPIDRIILPRQEVAAIPWYSTWVRCSDSYTASLCAGFIEALPTMVGGAFIRFMEYWHAGLIPPYEPLGSDDTLTLRRDVLVVSSDTGVSSRILTKSRQFTALFSGARVQITTFQRRRVVCQGEVCEPWDLNSTIP